MKYTRKLGVAPLLILTICALSACVTINIYFPAAAAEKVADKIIDDIWQLKDPDEKAAPSSSDDQANPAVVQPAAQGAM